MTHAYFISYFQCECMNSGVPVQMKVQGEGSRESGKVGRSELLKVRSGRGVVPTVILSLDYYLSLALRLLEQVVVPMHI
ncbi:hypothetical protein Tco_0358931 [Tanacetum coccineum]